MCIKAVLVCWLSCTVQPKYLYLFPGSTTFSRKQPLACWISSMLMCFSGSILSNFLVGEGIMAPFKHQKDLLLATAIWLALTHQLVMHVLKSRLFPIVVLVT